MNNIENRILDIIKEDPGLLAREIGDMIGLTRKEVNHYLYGEDLYPSVWQDSDYRWYPVHEVKEEKERGTFDLTKEEALQKYFGYSSFRGRQGEIIEDIIDGKDVLAIMPTGSGKSLCFQIPSLITTGTVIVISPLIALMKDQVDSLCKKGIKAATINSSQSEEENEAAIEQYRAGQVWILYISPERLQNDIDDYLDSIDITLFAIDEAHCISHWGHDFREDYTRLTILKEKHPDVPILALTATANSDTQQDIKYQLEIEDANEYIDSFDRPNIYIEVTTGYDRKQKLEAISKLYKKYKKQPGIVYCQTQRLTMSFAKSLQEMGIPADFYHAGMSPERRAEVQDAYMNDEIRVICATVAFGMGINKKNVRWVAHCNMPGCIENYYQEIGRAGRDGEPCHALLMYNSSDEKLPRKWADESGQPELSHKRLDDMVRFVKTKKCRRKFILNYFEQTYTKKKCYQCDNCK